jgi:hypothetical protein
MDSNARELLHENYYDADKTVLTATVSEEGGRIDFALKKSGAKPH